MNLQQLRAFVFTVRLRKLYLVAQAMGVSQPTVTFHLGRLQEEAGVPLFEANSFKTLRLTHAGQAFLHYAQNATAMVDELETLMDQFRTLRGAEVSIGCTYTPATYMLPRLLARLKQEYPELTVKLEVAPALDVAERVKRFDLDIGLVSESGMSDPELIKEPLMREDLVLTYHPLHPLAGRQEVSPDELSTYAYIAHEEGSLSRRLIDAWAESHGIRLNTALEVSQTETMKESVRYGIGFAMISERCVERDVSEGVLACRRIPDWTFQRFISLIRRPDKLISPAMGMLLAQLTEALESRLMDRSAAGSDGV